MAIDITIPVWPPPPVDRGHFFGKPATGGFAEGDTVSFVGYIAETKPGNAETVNCHCNGATFNYIHISLAPHALHLQKAAKNASATTKKQVTTQNNEALCTDSLTAEVTPHLRPPAYNRTAIDKLIDAKVVKVSGQLFFDTSHHPCDGDRSRQRRPYPVYQLGIHPVYSIQICKKASLDQCPATDPTLWKEMGTSQ